MPNYHRIYEDNACYFFTVVTHQRRKILCDEALRIAMRYAIIETRKKLPFQITAWVTLPDHIHCLWTLPEGDVAYSKRWSMIKRLTSQQCPQYHCVTKTNRNESGIWQRRFWEHTIRNEIDFNRHMDYIHFNPVKHGYVKRVREWTCSSFHRLVKQGVYDSDWGDNVMIDEHQQYGE